MKGFGWHHRLNEHEYGVTLGVSDEQEAWPAAVIGSHVARHSGLTELN